METREKQFPIWRTISIGFGPKTADEYRRAIYEIGNKISRGANDILSQKAFTVASEETTINLVLVTARILGFTKRTNRRDICTKAIMRGLDIIPAEVGPALRLAYQDQPEGEWLLVGMEPFGASRDLEVFFVAHDWGGLRLDCFGADPEYFWCLDDVWLFGRGK